MNHAPTGGNPKWQTDPRWTSAPRWKLKEHEISTGRGGLGIHEPWLVQVDVYLSDPTATPPEFQIESCLPHKTRMIGTKSEEYIQFDNHYRPGFRILFQLHDMTSMDDPTKGYRFPHKADDAIWSKKGSDCPDSTWGKNEVFQPVRVINPDRTCLVVDFRNEKDKNGNPVGDFRYTLRVTKDDQNYIELDPGGTGNNGND